MYKGRKMKSSSKQELYDRLQMYIQMMHEVMACAYESDVQATYNGKRITKIIERYRDTIAQLAPVKGGVHTSRPGAKRERFDAWNDKYNLPMMTKEQMEELRRYGILK